MSLLEKIYDLSPEESQLLHAEVLDEQLIEVREYKNYRWLEIGGDSIQGLMNVNSPEQILLPNIQALLVALLFCPKPNRVLNLGFGCGSIERFFIKQYPDLDITSLEASAEVIRLAKDYFFFRNEHSIVYSSAEEFLSQENEIYDIVLCDIFDDEQHPACLYDPVFYANIASHLDAAGVLAINLLFESEDDILSILSAMKNHFDHIALLEVPNHFNAIFFASNHTLPSTTELETAAHDLFNKKGLDLTALPQRLNRLMETIQD